MDRETMREKMEAYAEDKTLFHVSVLIKPRHYCRVMSSTFASWTFFTCLPCFGQVLVLVILRQTAVKNPLKHLRQALACWSWDIDRECELDWQRLVATNKVNESPLAHNHTLMKGHSRPCFCAKLDPFL